MAEETMIERVARANHATEFASGGATPEELARAAIEAMREPTAAMIKAAAEYALAEDAAGVWIAMIDAALKEKTPA